MDKFFLIPENFIKQNDGKECPSHLIINLSNIITCYKASKGEGETKKHAILLDPYTEYGTMVTIEFHSEIARNEWFNRIIFELFPDIKPTINPKPVTKAKRKPAKKKAVKKVVAKKKAKKK